MTTGMVGRRMRAFKTMMWTGVGLLALACASGLALAALHRFTTVI